jgi:DNA helicase-2/ATP-dependent DNA helicase PcrA
VQILTVHAAKGLEWQIVAVPHLCARVFPSTALARTWLNDAGALPPLLRGDRAEQGLHGVPVLDTSEVNDRKALETVIDAHRAELARRRIDEERRLLYVALTRAEDTLLLSGHHWGTTGAKPRGPSDFLVEIRDIIDASAQAGDPCGVVEHWAPEPADGEPNPLCDNVTEVLWPVDPLRVRGDVERGAAMVSATMAAPQRGADTADDPDGWIADVDALLAERARAHQSRPVTLPTSLSVSALVDLDRDRDAAARRLIRRLPSRPDPHAILGTAFHDWVQRIYGADRLFDLDDLPGSGDAHTADADELQALQDAFTASPWAARTPIDVEVGFEMAIGNTVVRGRIDAVFGDPDGGVTIVDWKTGEPPADDDARRHVAVQLAVYRLAWAGLTGRPESEVRAAFHYVRSGRTVTPDVLLGAEELAALLSPEGPEEERCA